MTDRDRPDPDPPKPRPSRWRQALKLIGVRGNGTLREELQDELAKAAPAMDTAEDFTREERWMLANMLKLREQRVCDVMVPRVDIHAVEITAPLNEIIAEFEASGHSRLPAFVDNLDDPKGMLHIKDVTKWLFDAAHRRNGTDRYELGEVDLAESRPGEAIVREVLFVPPSMKAADLLRKMQATRTHMALVIDEYGGTDGLISLEDIMETVFGDIEDEHDDDDEPVIEQLDDGSWLADARTELEDAQAAIGADFRECEMWDDIDTLGGLVFAMAERMPAQGEIFACEQMPGFEFAVKEAGPRRIKTLHVRRKPRKGGK